MIVKQVGSTGKRVCLATKSVRTPLEKENSDFWSERNQLRWMIHLKMARWLGRRCQTMEGKDPWDDNFCPVRRPGKWGNATGLGMTYSD